MDYINDYVKENKGIRNVDLSSDFKSILDSKNTKRRSSQKNEISTWTHADNQGTKNGIFQSYHEERNKV